MNQLLKKSAKVVLELNMKKGLLRVLEDLFISFLCFFIVAPSSTHVFSPINSYLSMLSPYFL